MRLAAFIHDHRAEIIEEWIKHAATILPEQYLNRKDLRDHADGIVSAIISDIENFQTTQEQMEKSRGRGKKHALLEISKTHAQNRAYTGYKLEHLIGEYRALRASILHLWAKSGHIKEDEIEDITRFNEAIDESIIEAASEFNQKIQRYVDEFIGILGHDLRNPLGAILMGLKLIKTRDLDNETFRVVDRLLFSSERMKRMIADILDLARARLGNGIPITVVPTDLGRLCRQVIEEIRPLYKEGKINFTCGGDLNGLWDPDRLAQVFSNIISNAIQHGGDAPINITLKEVPNEQICFYVSNSGTIPPEILNRIFEPMVSGKRMGTGSGSIGLGLYIVQQVLQAHHGTVVAQSENNVTSFTVHLPRNSISTT